VDSAILTPTNLTSLTDVSANNTNFDQIMTWSKSEVEEMVSTVACDDVSSVSARKALGNIVRDDMSEMNCSEVAEYCKYMNMSGVRTICPETCGCDEPQPDMAGFYQTAPWGCPGTCSVVWAVDSNNTNCEDILTTDVSETVWAKYVLGLQEYVLSRDGVRDRLHYELSEHFVFYGIKESQVDAMYEYIIEGDFWNNLANYSFFLSPNTSHPDGLVGCPFLASYQMLYLLNLNLCSLENDFLSLRMVCSFSCGCNDVPVACPSTCPTR